MPGLYDELLLISRTYMGIAAKDYIDRRIRIVTSGGDPQQITVDRIDRLLAGIEMTAKMYLSEKNANEFIMEINELKERTGIDCKQCRQICV